MGSLEIVADGVVVVVVVQSEKARATRAVGKCEGRVPEGERARGRDRERAREEGREREGERARGEREREREREREKERGRGLSECFTLVQVLASLVPQLLSPTNKTYRRQLQQRGECQSRHRCRRSRNGCCGRSGGGSLRMSVLES